jgi:hypothetical protein
MAISYAVISSAEFTRVNRQPGRAVGPARANRSNKALGVARRAYVRRAKAASAATSNEHLQPWRSTSTAAARCLAWMDGAPGTDTGQTIFAALPQALADHELVRLVLDWVKTCSTSGIVLHAAVHCAWPPRPRDRHCHLISRRQG